ncbi:MAG: formylglycine-generating enzyme family protein [Planctomycetota bacterium]
MKRIISVVVIPGLLFLGLGCGPQVGNEVKPPTVAPAPAVPEGMVFVEGGTFDMGADQYEREKPVYKVSLKSFMIGKYEVTFAEYDAYCQVTGKAQPSDQNWGRGSRPAINVIWYDAVAFCNWLSAQEGLDKCYSINGTDVTYNTGANGYRLPTEAEWEYAARGGNKNRGYTYSGSNDAGEVGWHDQNTGKTTQPAGGKKPNELGLFDMSGNVWEWCWDWYDDKYYCQSPRENPTGPSLGQYRVLRGGGWYGVDGLLRCASRISVKPADSYYFVGFRLARTSF